MITHVFHIHQHNWLVKAYINSDASDADLILGELWSVGADMDTMRMAFRNLRGGIKNTGIIAIVHELMKLKKLAHSMCSSNTVFFLIGL